MEVWLSLLVGLLSIAAMIGLGAWQLGRVAERITMAVERTVERVTMAIHEDIKRSQERLERRVEERRS